MKKNSRIRALMVLAILLIHVLIHGSAAGDISVPLGGEPENGFSSLLQGPPGYGAGLKRGTFLVAGRNIGDPRFYQTVILLVKHGPQGSLGCIINRPTETRLSGVLPELNEAGGRADTVFFGGPVGIDQVRMLLQSGKRHEEALRVFDDIYFIAGRESLVRIILRGDRDERFRVYAGYAGWAPGQLQHEVMRGDWHLLRADAGIVFHEDPSAVWPEMMRRASGRFWVENQRRQ